MAPTYRFREFELDAGASELRRSGVPVKIQDLPRQLLIALVERPAEIVTREELRSRLYPSDTFVEFDQSLNTAIRKLRQALGDSADEPRFVETLARKGYRFLAAVERIDAVSDTAAPEASEATSPPRSWNHRWTSILAATLGIVLLAGLIYSRLGPRARAEGNVPCAGAGHDLYLQGRYALNEGHARDLTAAAELFRRAAAASPDCALAYSGQAEVALFRKGRLPLDAMLEAKAATEKALALDPSLADAHSSAAMVRMYLDHDWKGAELEFRKAVSLQPQRAETHHRLGQLLAALGRFDEALVEGKRAVDLDPLAAIMQVDLGRIHYMARHYDEGIAIEREVLRRDPSLELARTFVWAPLLTQHRFDEAWAEVRAGMELSPQTRAFVPSMDKRVAQLGARGALRESMQQLGVEADRVGWVDTSMLADIFSVLEEREAALHYLELAMRSHTRDSIFVGVDPSFDSIRSEPRFQEVLRNLRRSPEPQAGGGGQK